MRRILAVAMLLMLALAGWVALQASPIDSVAWTPPPSAGFNGVYEHNDRLAGIELMPVPGGHGPESFALGPDGMLYTGLKGGRIIRFRPDGSGMEDFSNTNGRANGMRFDADGNLIVVDSYKGLLSIDPSGSVTTLATASEGQPFVFNDGVDIAADGIIWFTDATSLHADGWIHLELLEARSTGRVLAYDPESGETRTVLDNLRFPNGIALGPNDAYFLTNETLGYRTLRHWLKGPQAGTTEVFAENFPAMPDDIQFNGRDLFWVAMVGDRIALGDWIQPYPWIKNFIAKCVADTFPDSDSHWIGDPAFIIALDLDGNVVRNLQDAQRRFISSSGALEHADHLYIGSVAMDAVGRLSLAE